MVKPLSPLEYTGMDADPSSSLATPPMVLSFLGLQGDIVIKLGESPLLRSCTRYAQKAGCAGLFRAPFICPRLADRNRTVAP